MACSRLVIKCCNISSSSNGLLANPGVVGVDPAGYLHMYVYCLLAMGIANSFFEQQGFDKVINEIQRSLALSHTFKPPNDSESHWIQIHLVAKHSTLGWNQEKTIRIPCKQAASFDRQNIPHQWTCQPHPPRPAWFPRGSGRKWPGSIWHSHIMGITGVGSLFAVKVQPERPCVQCGQIRWYQSSWPQLFWGEKISDSRLWPLEASTSSYNGFGRFLVFGNGQKASHVRRRRLKSETKVCLVFPRYTVQNQYNNGSEGWQSWWTTLRTIKRCLKDTVACFCCHYL